jgi:hypothetical protein
MSKYGIASFAFFWGVWTNDIAYVAALTTLLVSLSYMTFNQKRQAVKE